jgi:hypothetical protein
MAAKTCKMSKSKDMMKEDKKMPKKGMKGKKKEKK